MNAGVVGAAEIERPTPGTVLESLSARPTHRISNRCYNFLLSLFMTPADLNFQSVLKEHVALIYGSAWSGSVEHYVWNRAMEIFSLRVMDQVRDAIGRAIAIAGLLTEEHAVHQMRFGAARRLLMMWRCYRNVVVYVAPPDRTDPLTDDDSHELTRDINLIYINVRGILDNLAWALLYELTPQKARKLHPARVGLFLRSIDREPSFSKLVAAIQHHRAWSTEVANRRDPAAHRIPLTVPPQVISSTEAGKYEAALERYRQASQRSDFEAAKAALDETEVIGKFCPILVHDPQDGFVPLYPTLPEDIGRVLELFSRVANFLYGEI